MNFLLELDGLSCAYDAQQVVRDFSLRLRSGTIACLLGPSGCGKTTVLRAIAGFQPPLTGCVRLRGATVAGNGRWVPPEHRRLGMVFQDYALFPHLNVLDNVGFGLRKMAGRGSRRRLLLELLELVGLADQSRRYPHELSGGQQQRVALARALAPEPDLILLDEPFSSLDVELRERLSVEVRDILKQRGVTALMVTHDQHEAFAMAELVGVMRDGQLLQLDSPYELYHEPADRFVADFIGQGRFIPATLLTPDTLDTGLGVIRGNRAYLWPPGTRLEVLLRPDDVVPATQAQIGGASSGASSTDTGASAIGQTQWLSAAVVAKAFKGAQTLYTLRCDNGLELLSLFPSHLNHGLGDQVTVQIDAEHLVAFERI